MLKKFKLLKKSVAFFLASVSLMNNAFGMRPTRRGATKNILTLRLPLLNQRINVKNCLKKIQ